MHPLAPCSPAFCLADRGSRWLTPLVRTASWGYARFHAGAASPPPCYGEKALANRAAQLAQLFGKAGLSTTRVPATAETLLGT